MGPGPLEKGESGRSILSLVRDAPTSSGASPSGTGSAAGSGTFSRREASRFAPGLTRVSAALPLPEPARTRLVLEMAGDLEMVYAHHRAAGRSEEEAARLAEEKVLASAEVLSRLAAVHRAASNGFSTPRSGGGGTSSNRSSSSSPSFR